MEEEETLAWLEAALTAGVAATTPCPHTALHLRRKGFLVVGRIGGTPRPLSEDELEYIVARQEGHIQ